MAIAYRCRELQFIRAVASALGLDPDRNGITNISLDVPARGFPIVTVKLFVSEEQDKALSEVVKRYGLVELSE
jgi:hypothetical protein